MKKFLIVCLLLIAPVARAAEWPAGTGADIGGSLTPGYEPSGIVWQERLSRLFLVWDNGYISQLQTDGTVDQTSYYGGDFEALTLVDSETNYIYVGVESPDSIKEFDVSSWEFTGKSWDLTPWMTGADNSGLEALTYVDGYFYAGLQEDGKIYVFNVNLDVSGEVNLIEIIDPPTGITADISGMHYSTDTEILYAIYDSSNLLVEMATDGTEIRRYDLPGQDQEGITLNVDCQASLSDIFIAQDSGQVYAYQNYPAICLVEEIPEEPAPEEPESPDESEVTLSEVEGIKNGQIKLTYSDESSENVTIFNITETIKNTKAQQWQDDYYIVLHPRGKKIALVNVATKEVITRKKIATTQKYPQNSLKIMELQQKDFAVAISKKKARVRVYLARIKDDGFGKEARLILTDSKVQPSRTSKYRENKIKLRGTKGKLRHTLKVNYKNSKYIIKEQ